MDKTYALEESIESDMATFNNIMTSKKIDATQISMDIDARKPRGLGHVIPSQKGTRHKWLVDDNSGIRHS